MTDTGTIRRAAAAPFIAEQIRKEVGFTCVPQRDIFTDAFKLGWDKKPEDMGLKVIPFFHKTHSKEGDPYDMPYYPSRAAFIRWARGQWRKGLMIEVERILARPLVCWAGGGIAIGTTRTLEADAEIRLKRAQNEAVEQKRVQRLVAKSPHVDAAIPSISVRQLTAPGSSEVQYGDSLSDKLEAPTETLYTTTPPTPRRNQNDQTADLQAL